MILHVFYLLDDFAPFLHLITDSSSSFRTLRLLVGYSVYSFVYLITCIFICAEFSVSAPLALMMELLPQPQRISGRPLA
jgi:hypothetical protein